jgi:excisionase family DNA binding protein
METTAIQPMLTVEEVAALLHQTVWVINKMAREGRIAGAKKIGRSWQFRRNEVRRFVEGRPN